jgi:hypothetical protein
VDQRHRHGRRHSGSVLTLGTDPRIARLIKLIRAALRPAPGAGRIALALGLGALCHTLFAAGVLAMIVAMFYGLSESLGTVPWPMAALANGALIAQFPSVFAKGVVRRFHAPSMISGALISVSGLSQTGPAGCQLRVVPDQRSGFCARASA